MGLNFSRVLPTLLARTVGFGIINCLDAQLLGQRMQYRRRHGQRAFQEGAEITQRPELHGEAKPVVCAALLRDQCVVAVVQVEVTGEVVGRWRSGVSAIAFALFIREKADRHECSC